MSLGLVSWQRLPWGRCLARLVLFCALALTGAGAGASGAQADWQSVDRIVAIADLHGDYQSYITVLEQAGVVDRRGRWAGKATHLVQLGDIPDRGPDTAKIIRHLMKLESQAEKAGGKVHPLIGNHEVMNMIGDLRYVDPGEYAALKSRQSQTLQDKYYRQVVAYLSSQEESPQIDAAFESQWRSEHPLGFVEHRQYWHPEGEFGAWVASHNTVIRINRSLFVHAGISPAYASWSMDAINDAVRADLAAPMAPELTIVEDENGPLWYRGLAMGAETPEVADQLAALLAHFDVDRIVLGHTPGLGTVVPRYQGQVLAADSGLAAHYGAHLASLLIEDNLAYTVQRGNRVPLPTADAGLLQYYRAINEIEPGVNNLLFRIQQLENAQPDGGE